MTMRVKEKRSVSERSTDLGMLSKNMRCYRAIAYSTHPLNTTSSGYSSALMLAPVHLAAFGHDTKEVLEDQFLLCPPPDNRTHGSLTAGLHRKMPSNEVGNTKYPVRLKSHGEMGLVWVKEMEDGRWKMKNRYDYEIADYMNAGRDYFIGLNNHHALDAAKRLVEEGFCIIKKTGGLYILCPPIGRFVELCKKERNNEGK